MCAHAQCIQPVQSSIAVHRCFINIIRTLPIFSVGSQLMLKDRNTSPSPRYARGALFYSGQCSLHTACLINREGKVINNVQCAKGQGQSSIQHKEAHHFPTIQIEGGGETADMLVCKPTIPCTWEELCGTRFTQRDRVENSYKNLYTSRSGDFLSDT